MKKVKLLLSVFVALIIAFSGRASHLNDNLLITAHLNGNQEVPSITTTASGVGSFMVNATRDTICVNVQVTGLSGPITGIHLHEGEMGTNGGVFIDLSPYVNGNNVTATLTGANVSSSNLAKFFSGKLYVNVHTAANPNGEIRGQLNLETDWNFSVSLDGSQEVPSVNTTAYGVGVFNVSSDLSKINYTIVVQGLSGAIGGAHLHYGAMGVDGGVAFDLSSNVNGNVISGTISMPTQMLIDSILASKVYINVHTTANAAGEIRGQLMNNSWYLYFDAALDGNQLVPSVSTSAMGSANIMLNATFDTLWYDVAVDGLSGAITSAHFHSGAKGTNGSVEYDFDSNVNGNRIKGKITGTDLSTSLINKFLRGEIYINIHTTANPNGEIRGQVYRAAREGYVVKLDGAQEVPSVSTMAMGLGIVSINRDQDNAHYMIVTSGLTATGAHFHKGVWGANGGVIYDFDAAFSNNGAFGYWRSSDANPFTLMNSIQFRNDSVYVNIHTSTNPNGEIRGQAMNGYSCDNMTTGIENNLEYITETTLYPNPTSNTIHVTINSIEYSKVTISIVDVLGHQISSEKLSLNPGINNQSFNLGNYHSGVYFVKIQNGNNQIVRKFAKN